MVRKYVANGFMYIGKDKSRVTDECIADQMAIIFSKEKYNYVGNDSKVEEKFQLPSKT